MARLRDLILADSPLGYWPLDDSDYTQVTDISGNARHGSFVGSPSLLQQGPTDAQKSMLFDGASQYLTFPTSAIVTGANPRTMLLVCNLPWSSAGVSQPLLHFAGNGNATGFTVRGRAPNLNTGVCGDGTIFLGYSGSYNLAMARCQALIRNQWTLIAACYTGTQLKLYVGLLFNSSDMQVASETVATLDTGANTAKMFQSAGTGDASGMSSSTEYTAGFACHVAMFDKALSQARLNQYRRAAALTAAASKVPVAVDIGGTPTQRRVRVFGRATGELLADELTDSSGVGAPTMYYDGAVDVIAIDDVGERWYDTKAYAVNALAIPATANGHYYKCTTAGTSGGTEPTWPTTSGGTVTDGGAVWTEQGTIAAPAVYGPFNPVPA